MALHGAHRHRQPIGDVTIAQAGGDQVGDLAFANRQGQRVSGEIQCGRADSAALGGQAVGGGGRFHAAAPVVDRFERNGRLRGRISGGEQRAELLELLGSGEDPLGIAVSDRGRVGGDHRRQAAAGTAGQVDEPIQAGLVSEADRVVQRQHLDRPLSGLRRQLSGIERQFDCGADISLRRGQPGLGDPHLRPEHRDVPAETGPQLGHHLGTGFDSPQHAIRLRQQHPGREAPRRRRLRRERGDGLFHPGDGVGEPAAGKLDGALEHVRHAPGQVLARRGDTDDVGGSLCGRVEVAAQRQGADLTECGEIPEQAVDLVLDGVATLGDDGEVQQRAAEIYARYLKDPASVDRDLVPPVIGILAYAGDRARYEEFKQRFKSARTPQEEQRYLFSLANFHRPELLRATMEMTLNGEVRTQNAPYLMHALLLNTVCRYEAWDFVKKHWEEMIRKFPDAALPRMCEAIVGLLDREAEVHEFFQAHRVRLGGKIIDQHLERLRVSVAFRRREGANLAATLKG